MSHFKDKNVDMKELMHQICKQVKGLTQQVFLTVWDAFRKFTFQQLQFERTIVILDSFYLQLIKQNQIKTIKLMPTSTLMAQLSLNYRSDDNDLNNLGSLISLTEGNLFKNIETNDKQTLQLTKQNAFFIYTFTFKYIKNIIKKYKSVNLQLDFLGSITIYQRTFTHQPQLKNTNNEKIKVKQLIERESIQNLSDLKRQSLLDRSKKNLLQRTKSNIMNSSSFSSLKLNDQSHLQSSQHLKRKLSPQYQNNLTQKRPFYHEMNDSNKSQNVRIINDLLGAGIDPLTYDYNISKMVENSSELFYHKFEKPQKAKPRLPGLIDKFSRTIGAQLTGAKVSTSSSIRIGSNYCPSAKNFYIDLSKKQIMRVPQQITIKLTEKIEATPASQEEQYRFFLYQSQFQNDELEQKVQLRKKTYQRYQQYCIKQIPNDCVAPISRQILKNIADKVKDRVKSLGKAQGKEIFDKLLNQVNKFYYLSSKKAIVDYILKDESQKNRTGITIIFKPVHDWGIVKSPQFFPQIDRENTIRKRLLLQSEFLTYPQLILQIVKHNQILDTLSPFNPELPKNIRPMNVLYHLKKHSNNFAEIITFLNENWVKGVVQIITKHKNWKKQKVQNFKTLMNNVHVLMSNKLRDLVTKTIDIFTKINSMFDYQNPPSNPKPVLYLHLGEENRKIIFMDDLNNIYRKEMSQLHKDFLKSLSQILSPQCYIKEGQQRFLWSIDPNDMNLSKFNQKTEKIIQENFEQIEKIKESMRRFQKIYKYKDELVQWTKTNLKPKQLDIKLRQLKNFQKQIQELPFFLRTLIAVIDCHDLKKKLNYEIKLMRYYLFECIENLVKKTNHIISQRINDLSQKLSKQIKCTADYVELSKLIQNIKSKQLVEISQIISQNQKSLMKLFLIQNCYVNQDLLKEIYSMQKLMSNLQQRLALNEERIFKERSQLQKTLKQRISDFQSLTVSQLRQINLRIDSFQVRKLYTEYLVYLMDFKQKSQKNMKEMLILNHEQDDLKWASTTFSSAIELDNLITPNVQLWRLVEFYDQNIRQWKHLQLCNFDIEKTQSRMTEVDAGISKIINKLKNFSSLKIAHQLQIDVKQVITRQIPIIKIFSHPGLKERHWHLFSKKLSIPGYDLKQIIYGRIKILYDYEKNLKVLASISNQAAKQFEIQNEKNHMSTYWYSLNCQTRSDSMDEQMVFIQDDFLNQQIATVEDHLMRTLLIKNSPFSKALNQMLNDWQNYLLTAKSILMGFKNAQQGFLGIKDIFKNDDISKYLPIQNTQFQSIENIWRSVIKKVLQQPKVTQLFKSQKIIEILDEITKKSHHIKNSLPVFLHSKRVQFPRFFFVNDCELIEIFSLLNRGKEKQALNKISSNCFNGMETIQKIQKGYRMRSSIDYLDLIVEKQQLSSKKDKAKIIEDLPSVLSLSKQKIKNQIKLILAAQNLSDNQSSLSKYTMTAILTAQHIIFSQKISQIQNDIKQNTQKSWKMLQKYSKQCLQYVQQKKREVNMNEVRKTDFIVFRKLCYKEIFDFLLRRNDGFIDSSEIEGIPVIKYKNVDGSSFFLQIQGFYIDLDYEYLGSDILGFQPYNPTSSNLMSQMIQNINSGSISLLHKRDSKIVARMLAQMSGRFYKQIDFISYINSNTNGIYQILGGLVSSDTWINLNMDNEALIKLASDNLSLISEIIAQKRTKIAQNSDFLIIGQNQIPLYKGNAMFFYVDQQIYNRIPNRLFSSCRNLSLASSQSFEVTLMKFLLSNEVLIDWQTFSMLKIIIETLRNMHPQTQLKISQILDDFNSVLTSVEDGQNVKVKKVIIFKMLERYLHNQAEQKTIKNFLKLQPKQIQYNLRLKAQKNTEVPQINLGIQKYLHQKVQELEIQSKFYDNIIVYGMHGHKTTIVQNFLQKMHFSVNECEQITINTGFVVGINNSNDIPSVQRLLLKAMKSYQKASKMSQYQRINPIIFEGLINDQRLKLITDALNQHKNNNLEKPVTCLIQCPNLNSLSPQQITNFGKVFISNYQISDKTLYEEWAQKLPLKSEQIDYVKSLSEYLEGIIDTMFKNKHILTNSNKDYPSRFLMVKCFLKFFQIYLMNLNTKEVQALPQFDIENYILNSYVFAAYWALGAGFAVDDSRRALQIYLKETFGCQYDLPHSIQDHLLNEQNQWVSWENIKQEFAPQKQADSPLCSLWVPTIQNTKFYTIIIKLLQKDLPVIILGHQSGKSTLLKQIPNFQITYSTFLIDCNKSTDVFKVGKLIRERIIYGDEKKNLILVDDLHLPLKNNQTRINELLLQIAKKSTIPTFSQYGPINQKLKKSNLLISANLNEHHSSIINEPSIQQILSRFQPMSLKRIDEREMQCIYKPYLSFFFNHNEFQYQQLKLQGTIMLILIRLFDSQKLLRQGGKQFIIDLSDIRKIVESMCRITRDQFKDKFEILSYLIYETNSLLQSKIELSLLIQDSQKPSSTDPYAHFKKALQVQHTKFCNPEKNNKQFDNLLSTYIYKDVPFYDSNLPLDKNQMKNKIKNHLKLKSYNHPFVLTSQIVNTLQKLIHFIQTNPSHIIFVTSKRSGARSLINIISKLKNLNYIELGTSYHVEQFLQQVIKILKTGGKVDECICCLPNDKQKQDEFLGVVNSLISSGQFYESLNQIQLQQIIKSFNSQKKVLKKDIKKSQIIKKIKQKLNSIFHFVVCVEQNQLFKMAQTYPNMFRDSFIFRQHEWNDQSIVEIFSELFDNEKDEIKRVTITFENIYEELNKIQKDQSITQQTDSTQGMNIISLMEIYHTFSQYFTKMEQSNSQTLNLWQKKINLNQAKLSQLLIEKTEFQFSNKSRFSEIQELKTLIEEKTNVLIQKKAQFKQIEQAQNEAKQNLLQAKSKLFLQSDELVQKLNASMGKQFKQLRKQKLSIKQCIQNGLLHFLVDNYQVLYGKDQLTVDDFGLLFQTMRKESFAMIFSEGKCNMDRLTREVQHSTINPMQKAFLNILISLWPQITQNNKNNEKFKALQILFNQKQQLYVQTQTQIRSIQDEIQQAKDEIQQLTEKNSKLLSLHEEIKAKITHLQQLIDIFKRLKAKFVDGKNINTTDNQGSGLSQNQMLGLKILLTVCLKERISDCQSPKFKAVKHALMKENIQLTQKHLLHALGQEKRILIEYSLNDNSFSAILNNLIVQLSPVYCVAIDHENELQKYLRKYNTNRQINYLETGTVQELKSLIIFPGFVIVANPKDQLIQKIKPILSYPKNKAINAEISDQISQFSFHHQAKIIFLYTKNESISHKILNSTHWICEISHQNNSQKIIQNFLCKLTSNRDTQRLALLYLEKQKELESLGQRMYGMVIKMKKQHLTMQQIQHKIAEINSHKVSIEKNLENFKSELKQIFITKPQLNKSAQLILSLYNTYHIRLSDLLKLISDLYELREKHFLKALQQASSLVQGLMKKRDKKENKLQKKKHYLQSFSKDKSLIQKTITIEEKKTVFNSQMDKVNYNLLLNFINLISKQHCLLRSEEPNIAKKCILTVAIKENLPLIQRKITQINSITFMPNLWILTQVKTEADWSEIHFLLKSIKDKKLSIKLLILAPLDIQVSISIRDIKQFNLKSFLMFLVKLMFQNQDQLLAERRIELFYEIFVTKVSLNKFQKLSILQQELVNLK